MTFAREAWVFVLPVALVAVAALLFQWPKSALAIGLLAALILAFFRIPSRAFDGPDDVVLAPANGTITAIETVDEPLVAEARLQRITTFLSVFNIHVQRAPVAGRVLESRFQAGRKIAAFKPEAGEVNESHLVVIETSEGARIGVKQIAGLVARRVVSYLETGQTVARGELIGVIKFGSRVDLYLPLDWEVQVAVGDRVTEGATAMALRPAGETSSE